MSERKYLTVEEVAERFRTNPRTVYDWVLRGVGPRSIKVGRRRLFPEADVDSWAESKAS